MTEVEEVVITILAAFFALLQFWSEMEQTLVKLSLWLKWFILSLLILNYSWWYKIHKPRKTSKVILKIQPLLSHERSSIFQCSLNHFQARKLYLRAVLKVASKNILLVSCFVKSKFCWQSAEIRLPYYLSSLYIKWLGLNVGIIKRFSTITWKLEFSTVNLLKWNL